MTRPIGSPSPLGFGRRAPFVGAAALPKMPSLSPELRLFAGTYAAGFLLVSLLIA